MTRIDYFGTQQASLNGFYNFCKKNIPLIITVTIALFFAYGIKLSFYSIGIDTEGFGVNKNAVFLWNIQLGRFGLGLLQKLWYIKEFNPYTHFLAGLVLFCLAALSWCYVIGVVSKNTERNNSLIPFALVFTTSPVWAEHFYFVFQAAETAFIIGLSPYVIYFLYHGFLGNKKVPVIVGTITLSLMIAVYQAILPLFICGIFICFILLQEHSDYDARVYSSLCLKLFVTLLASLALYTILDRLWLHLAHLQKFDYFNFVSKWGRQPLKSAVGSIIKDAFMITVGQLPPVHSLFALSIRSVEKCRIMGNVLLLPVMIIFIGYIVAQAKLRLPPARRILYILAGLGVPLSIMLMTIIGGNSPPWRSLWALPFATAFMWYYLIRTAAPVTPVPNTARKTWRIILYCLALITSLRQAELTAGLFYSDYNRYQNDVRLAQNIDTLIHAQGGGEMLSVALIGKHQATETAPADFIQGEVIGHSFFELDTGGSTEASLRGIGFMKTLGINYKIPNEAQMGEARRAALTMPNYPAPGCVRVLDDVIVVKLSESTYKP